jgi:hypothetical protein
MKYLGIAAILVVGCCKPVTRKPEEPPAEVHRSTSGRVELAWTMKRQGDRLRIAYTVTNGTAERIYLLDRLPTGDVLDPAAIIVMNGEAPGTVAFVRGLVPTKGKMLYIPRPSTRAVEAGARITGSASTPWPLRAWHNYSNGEDALREGATSAVLRIGYVPDPGPAGLEQHTFYGETVTDPLIYGGQVLLTSEPHPLPE